MTEMEQKERFTAQIAKDFQWQVLFNHLPGVCLFMKDAEGRFMGACKTMVHRLGLESESDLIGRTDSDFFPEEMVDGCLLDDREVMKTGEPLVERLEMLRGEALDLSWFVTTKYPLFDDDGNPIGILGMTRDGGKGRRIVSFTPRVTQMIAYIEENYAEPVRIEPLVDMLGGGPRQLHRIFLEEVGISIRAFHTRTRIMAGADHLLESNMTIGEIAQATGFNDQSTFSTTFRKQMGCTPMEFRFRSKTF